MNRNTLWGTFAVVLLFVLGGLISHSEADSINSLDGFSPPQSQLIVAEGAANTSQLVNAHNHFGFSLFSQLQSTAQSSNIFVSPPSMAIALAMIRNGATGETLGEINQTLGLDEFDATTIDYGYQRLITTLTTELDRDVELAIANSLWVNEEITLQNQFVEKTRDFYQGKVTNLDFADPASKKTINKWVASNTKHKIPEIVDAISPQDALYLVNAIYFRGSWTNQFETQDTAEQPFTLEDGQSKPVAMMSQMGDYRYHENEQFQVIRLPYGKQGELGMYIFLPQPNSNLEQFNQQLNLDNWEEWLSQMRSQPGNITLPKFKLEYETELKDVLTTLGIKQVFDSRQADLGAMTDTSMGIDTFKHKAVIEVNEEGSEAAGITSVGIRITSAIPGSEPFNMNVNRPFFFAIRDDITETLLFMGNVNEPQYSRSN